MSAKAGSAVIGSAPVRTILLVKFGGVGDVLLSTVVIRNLALAFPGAAIDFLTTPASAEILRGNRDLREVLLFDRKSVSSVGLIRMVRDRGYDMVIDLFGNPRTALVTRLSRAPHRIGYRFRGRTYAYNIVVEPRGGMVHNTQFNLDAMERIDVAIQDRNLYFPVLPEDHSFAEEFLGSSQMTGKRIVAIGASGGWYTKRWGKGRFAELADRLIRRQQVSVVILWGPGERQDAEEIQGAMGEQSVLIPSATLKQLGAILGRCALMISNDSGPMHMAAAVGTRVLGIYGPTNPALQGPYGAGHRVVRNESIPCLGCNLTSCDIGHVCMVDLTVDQVAHVAESMLTEDQTRS